MDDDDLRNLIQKQLLRKGGYNEDANVDLVNISDTTFKLYKEKMTVSIRKGKVKPVSRVEPYLNVRNAIRSNHDRVYLNF